MATGDKWQRKALIRKLENDFNFTFEEAASLARARNSALEKLMSLATNTSPEEAAKFPALNTTLNENVKDVIECYEAGFAMNKATEIYKYLKQPRIRFLLWSGLLFFMAIFIFSILGPFSSLVPSPRYLIGLLGLGGTIASSYAIYENNKKTFDALVNAVDASDRYETASKKFEMVLKKLDQAAEK